MSGVIPVSAEWLTLREHADAHSRSRALARDAGRMASVPIVVHDLGSGTGAMMRWLAPLLPGPQTWVLHDWNAVLLDRAVSHPAHDAEGRHVVVRTNVQHVEQLGEGDLAGASLVTGSALLDVLTRGEVAAIVRSCVAAGSPALFTLSVTGVVRLEPDDAGDRVFEAAFNDHQRRTLERRRLLGPDGADAAAGLFRAAGWSVRVAESPWRLGPSDAVLLERWLDGWVDAATAERAALREWAREYLRARAAQRTEGVLSVVVHHRDLLAWPQGRPR